MRPTTSSVYDATFARCPRLGAGQRERKRSGRSGHRHHERRWARHNRNAGRLKGGGPASLQRTAPRALTSRTYGKTAALRQPFRARLQHRVPAHVAILLSLLVILIPYTLWLTKVLAHTRHADGDAAELLASETEKIVQKDMKPTLMSARAVPLASKAAAMPRIIYGTAWKKEKTQQLVVEALRAGFRGIDTACQPKHYFEPGVGAALREVEKDVRSFVLLAPAWKHSDTIPTVCHAFPVSELKLGSRLLRERESESWKKPEKPIYYNFSSASPPFDRFPASLYSYRPSSRPSTGKTSTSRSRTTRALHSSSRPEP